MIWTNSSPVGLLSSELAPFAAEVMRGFSLIDQVRCLNRHSDHPAYGDAHIWSPWKYGMNNTTLLPTNSKWWITEDDLSGLPIGRCKNALTGGVYYGDYNYTGGPMAINWQLMRILRYYVLPLDPAHLDPFAPHCLTSAEWSATFDQDLLDIYLAEQGGWYTWSWDWNLYTNVLSGPSPAPTSPYIGSKSRGSLYLHMQDVLNKSVFHLAAHRTNDWSYDIGEGEGSSLLAAWDDAISNLHSVTGSPADLGAGLPLGFYYSIVGSTYLLTVIVRYWYNVLGYQFRTGCIINTTKFRSSFEFCDGDEWPDEDKPLTIEVKLNGNAAMGFTYAYPLSAGTYEASLNTWPVIPESNGFEISFSPAEMRAVLPYLPGPFSNEQWLYFNVEHRTIVDTSGADLETAKNNYETPYPI